MPGNAFCGRCGAPAAFVDDRFCRECGASLHRPSVIAVAEPSSTSEPATRAAAPVAGQDPVSRRRPWWPWLLVIAGAGLAAYWASQAVVQNSIVTAIEQSGGAKITGGMQYLGRWIPGLDTIASLIDPRHQQQYLSARNALAADITMTLFGFVLGLAGLIAAVARPVAGVRGGAGTAGTVLVAGAVLAILVLGSGQVHGVLVASDASSSSSAPATLAAPTKRPVPSSASHSGSPRVVALPATVVVRAHPTPTPALKAVWRPPASQVGPFKLDPGEQKEIPLQDVPAKTRIKLELQVAFNSAFSAGVPDVYMMIDGIDGEVLPWTRSPSGTSLSFEATRAGWYRIVISNEHSTFNAKQVVVAFK